MLALLANDLFHVSILLGTWSREALQINAATWSLRKRYPKLEEDASVKYRLSLLRADLDS